VALAGTTDNGRQMFAYAHSSGYTAAQAVFEEAQVLGLLCDCTVNSQQLPHIAGRQTLCHLSAMHCNAAEVQWFNALCRRRTTPMQLQSCCIRLPITQMHCWPCVSCTGCALD
jgi:hypothetical protein